MCKRRLGLVAVALAYAGSARAGEPSLDLVKCDALDESAVRAAIHAERPRWPDRDVRVAITCPDDVTAVVHVEPAPRGSGPYRLDIGDLPVELRPRLVALAISELLNVAAWRDAAALPNPELTPSSPIAAPALLTGPPPRLHDHARPRDRGRPARVLGRAGIRIFAPRTTVAMAEAAIGAGPATVGVAGGAGRVHDPLGELTPWLVAATGTLTIGCVPGRVTLCTAARAELGAAGVAARTTEPDAVARGAVTLFTLAGVALTAMLPAAKVTLRLDLDAGWSMGLVALADEREAVRLAGAVLGASMGVHR